MFSKMTVFLARAKSFNVFPVNDMLFLFSEKIFYLTHRFGYYYYQQLLSTAVYKTYGVLFSHLFNYSSNLMVAEPVMYN